MRVELTGRRKERENLLIQVARASGQNIAKCYQCGKCTAGCPVAVEMDIPPHQVMRLLQLGLKDEVLDSSAIWLCASCATCTARCPRDIDIAAVMDALRARAGREGRTRSAKTIALFHDIFLNAIQKHGRVFELGLAINYNLKTGNLFKDADLGRVYFTRGKIGLKAPKIKGGDEVRRIFQKVKQMEAGE
ncbi:MAG: 4Fe-4S dicluster domain-containing protein [Peptococcaceae bacterium]|nr:4Fe-4S dicluster domain-containing protein [Peptococcaceae bacterium]